MTAADKVTRYDWQEIGKRWPTRFIPKHKLQVDPAYQRDAVAAKRVRQIASRWDYAAAGSLVVSQRADGTLWVIDGQHRLEAARLRDDVLVLLCLVASGLSVAEEAALFRTLNEVRIPVGAAGRFKAGVSAGEVDYVDCAMMLAAQNLRCDGTGTKGAPASVRFPACIMRTYRTDAGACSEALRLQRLMVGPDAQLSERIHTGLFYILRRHPGPEVEGRARGVFSAGGRDYVENRIHAYRMRTNCQAWKSVEACIAGVLEVLNHGRRNKLTME